MTNRATAVSDVGHQATPVYRPPTVPSDPRVCGNCRETHEDAVWFPIKNERTGKYHSGGDYGMTDCGVDATEDNWLWPI